MAPSTTVMERKSEPVAAIPHTPPFTRRLEWPVLATILLCALILRTWNINFDQGAGSHPDERSTACFVATTIGLPRSWDEFRDPQRSPLNPLWDRTSGTRRSFTYGHFPLYLGVGMGNLLHTVAPLAEQVAAPLGISESSLALMSRANFACDGLAVAGRLTIALLDVLTVYLVFLLARAAFPGPARGGAHWIALLAAAFYAFTAQAIQLSHFFAMDPASTTFTVLAVLAGVFMVQKRTWGAATLCGVGMGLAVASKFSALPVLAIPITAGVLVMWQAAARAPHARVVGMGARGGTGETAVSGSLQFYAVAGVVWSMLVAVLTFAVTSPYALLDWSSFVQATLVEQGRMVRGVADFPFTRQYRGTTPYLYFIEQQLAWGMWWPLGLLALTGAVGGLVLLGRTLWHGARLTLGRSVPRFSQVALANVVVWAWVLPYFGITGAFLAKFNRYMSPVLPFAAILAAGLIWWIWQWGHSQRRAANLPVGFEAAEPPLPPERSWAGEAHKLSAYAGGLAQALASGFAGMALLASIFWSAAYVNGVYGSEHTWITASRWAYENMPAGSVILWELWDDPIPLRSLPGEPELNLGSMGLTHIDWSPYEEDTREKFEILRDRLQRADYVAYSSKRIYASVDNLPERYPMTMRYYEGMWDGSLGFEVAVHVTSPPRLFGWEFPDHTADESWSLYDHPQVTIFRKVRELSDAEFAAYFDQAWEQAVPYYRGQDSFLSPVLEVLGLGQSPEGRGLLGAIMGLVTGGHNSGSTTARVPLLLLDQPLATLALVDEYRWNHWASGQTWGAVAVWWAALWLLGMVVWPIAFRLGSGLRDRGYLFSRSLGWLLAGWLLWVGASLSIWYNTVRNAWLVLAGLALVTGILAWRQRSAMVAFVRRRWAVIAVGELCFAIAFLAFVQIRIWNPDLWQPWNGGEKFMEFAFLNGILRSPTFPPVNPHFAGGFINYYYYGLYLVAYLVKLTGIYAEVAFNLAVASLFALTALNTFALVYNAVSAVPAVGLRTRRLGRGVGTAALAALFVVVMGNLDAVAQLVRNVSRGESVPGAGVLGVPLMLLESLGRWIRLLAQGGPLPAFNFWDPSRVIPYTINEFPFWTFLFADLHPHMIVMPFSLLLVGGIVQVLAAAQSWHGRTIGQKLSYLAVAGAGFGIVTGALAVINLWEYPTYLGLTLLLAVLLPLRGVGIGWTLGGWALAGAMSYVLYGPFFQHYVGIGASGIGLVREPDALGPWLLIWGFFVYVLLSWAWWQLGQTTQVHPRSAEAGLSRGVRLLRRKYDRLPRLIRLMRSLVLWDFGTLLGALSLALVLVLILVAIALNWWVLAIALLGVVLTIPLLTRVRQGAQTLTVLAAICAFTGFLIQAGTQVVFVRDFLQGGEWYRMNTLFKFYMQVWLLWGIAAAIGFVDLWRATSQPKAEGNREPRREYALQLQSAHTQPRGQLSALAIPVSIPALGTALRVTLWRIGAVMLLIAAFAYPLLGTPARIDNRMVGWRPPIGTLNGMAFMEQGSYTWPDDGHRIELGYDHAAILWILDNIRGNLVVAEAAEVDYYRAGGTRIASFTGLSGLMGKHENEQRDGAQVAARHALMREFWNTSDIARTLDIARELEIALVYVGQLERHQHPEADSKFRDFADRGVLMELYSSPGGTLYAFPNRIEQAADGIWLPVSEVADVG